MALVTLFLRGGHTHTTGVELDCTCGCVDICEPEPVITEDETPSDDLTAEPVPEDTCGVNVAALDVGDPSPFTLALSQAGAEPYVHLENGAAWIMPIGTPIYSLTVGTVVLIDGLANPPAIHVKADDSTLYYSGFDDILVSIGDAVLMDTLLGYSGVITAPSFDIAMTPVGPTNLDRQFEDNGYVFPTLISEDDVLSGAYVPEIPTVTPGYTPINSVVHDTWAEY